MQSMMHASHAPASSLPNMCMSVCLSPLLYSWASVPCSAERMITVRSPPYTSEPPLTPLCRLLEYPRPTRDNPPTGPGPKREDMHSGIGLLPHLLELPLLLAAPAAHCRQLTARHCSNLWPLLTFAPSSAVCLLLGCRRGSLPQAKTKSPWEQGPDQGQQQPTN